jgi:hypothetical protein
VTEVGDVEYVMFATILAVTAEKDANEVHRAFYNETFGPKVAMPEKRLEHSAFDEHQDGLNHLIRMLRKLTTQRNNIIHGEIFYLTRRNETKVFRVGFTRKNLKPWKDFSFKGNAENIFTSDQINKVITDCIAIKTDLDLIRQKVRSIQGAYSLTSRPQQVMPLIRLHPPPNPRPSAAACATDRNAITPQGMANALIVPLAEARLPRESRLRQIACRDRAQIEQLTGHALQPATIPHRHQ